MDIPHLQPGMIVRTNVLELQPACATPGKIVEYAGHGFYRVNFCGMIRTIHYKGLMGW